MAPRSTWTAELQLPATSFLPAAFMQEGVWGFCQCPSVTEAQKSPWVFGGPHHSLHPVVDFSDFFLTSFFSIF